MIGGLDGRTAPLTPAFAERLPAPFMPGT